MLISGVSKVLVAGNILDSRFASRYHWPVNIKQLQAPIVLHIRQDSLLLDQRLAYHRYALIY